jgi:hypothetical protein
MSKKHMSTKGMYGTLKLCRARVGEGDSPDNLTNDWENVTCKICLKIKTKLENE